MAASSADIRNRALRALVEGTDISLARIAEACGRSVNGLLAQAEREGWTVRLGSGQDVAARVRQVAGQLLGRLEALGSGAGETGKGISKAEIDGIIAMVRGLDKIGEIMRPDEAAKENQIGSDEDVAAVLQAINDRIIALARELAASLVAGECGRAEGLADPQRVVP
nr:hypothetical protein [Mesorhizobium sp.]